MDPGLKLKVALALLAFVVSMGGLLIALARWQLKRAQDADYERRRKAAAEYQAKAEQTESKADDAAAADIIQRLNDDEPILDEDDDGESVS